MQFGIIYTGDCLNLLKTLHDDSVHCCVTSPLRITRYAITALLLRSVERQRRINISRIRRKCLQKAGAFFVRMVRSG